MSLDAIARRARKLARPYTVSNGKKFRLKDIDPADTGPFKKSDKGHAQEALTKDIATLAELQDRLYAHDRWAVLLIFQAMDAAGKDSAIKHVMSGINPQGCQVFAFKSPSSEELDHDYLWRCMKCMPERGRIGIFNRSYYEEVLVVRVHPDYLRNEKLPESLVTPDIWKDRFEDIRNTERYLARNGVLVCKFFLHVSRQEQKARFLQRLEDPEKHWKFAASDVNERRFWPQYMEAYEDMIRHTATPWAPWYVVPADNKWFTRMVVAAAVIDALCGLDLKYPEVSPAKRNELKEARRALRAE